MKKFGFFLFLALGLMSCGDDNNDPTPEQHVTCAISEPKEGAEIDIAGKMVIKGEGTAVPFTHEYTFDANQAEGALKIELYLSRSDFVQSFLLKYSH